MHESTRDEFFSIPFWDRLVQRGAAHGLARVRELIETADLAGDARALAEAATSRCLFEMGHLTEAMHAATRALSMSTEAERTVRTWIAMGASVVLAETGEIDGALSSLRELEADSDGVEQGRVLVQIAYVQQHAGRLLEALAELDRSEQIFAASGGGPGDRLRLHHNRGLLLLQQGRLRAAESDFAQAESIATDLGLTSAVAQNVANRAVLLARERRLVESVHEFDRAARLFEESGNPMRPVAIMSIDRAELMMHSGLLVDAVQAGEAAVAAVSSSGNAMLQGDAYLMIARAQLAAGRHGAAIQSASSAATMLAGSGRDDMVAHARAVLSQAEFARAREGSSVKRHLEDAAEVVDALRVAGWNSVADDLAVARIRTARLWDLVDDVDADVRALRVGATDGRRDTALSGWFAEAIGRSIDGDVPAAIEACHAGLSVLDEIVAEAPTLERRSAAMRLGQDLSQLLIELAIDRGDADTVLAAAEGTRGRALHDEIEDRRRYQPLTREGAADLRRELAVRLGDRTLVEWLIVRDRVWAVVFGRDGTRLVDVADRRSVTRGRDRALGWLDRAASEPDAPSGGAARAARSLEEMLVEPLGLPDAGGVVIVPVDALHGIPWAGLPGLSGREMVLSPNAQVWLNADRRTPGHGHGVGMVLGPGVNAVDRERSAVNRSHPGAAVAVGVGATAATVSSMFARCDLVHVAAHGTFRSDHPLLSTLRLVDGEATMYDAVPERVHARLVILSSCDGGAQGTADGSEVLGLSSVLLARGAAAVLAPLTAVRELECAEFVAEVHDELATGAPFAIAVAAVRTRWLADDDLSRWAVASSFTCFGSGAVTVVTPT